MAAGGTTRGQTGKLPVETQAQIERVAGRFIAEGKAPGVSVAVVRDGEFVWAAGFGMADLENSVSAKAETVYRLASISKALTGTAAVVLSEQGGIDLDAPVQKYCPGFPKKPWPVTTRQALGHIGGIRHYNVPEMPYSASQSDPEVGNTRHFENGIQAGLEFFQRDPLIAEPGTHFHYSTQGYTLVACAIEGAAGQAYADYVSKSVLVPAGMVRTQPDDRVAIVPLRTRYYSKDRDGGVVNAEYLDASYKVGGGGWLSAAPDMARFIVALLDDRLMKRPTRELMWTAVKSTDRLGRMAYGLGWQLGALDGVKIVGHSGGQQGTSTMLLIAPERRAGVVVLTNSDAAPSPVLAKELLGIVLGLSAREAGEVAVDAKAVEGYLGTYRIGEFKLTFAREGERLFAQFGAEKILLIPRGPREYAFTGFDTQIVFETDGQRRAEELILRQSSIDTYLSRVE